MPGLVWEDSRVVEGMERQLERRARAVEEGARPIGWKLAFGTDEVKAELGLAGPAVGYLTDATTLESGASCPIDSWSKPVLEAEIAIHLAEDVPPGANRERADAAIRSLGAGIELADVGTPAHHLAEVIAGGISHRAVILATDQGRRAGSRSDDLAVTVWRDGEECASNDDPVATVGDLGGLVSHVADYLGAFGESLRAGEVIISGSTIGLIPIEPGQRLRYALDPIGVVEVQLTATS